MKATFKPLFAARLRQGVKVKAHGQQNDAVGGSNAVIF